tara:strand:- start:199 stop:429 length:231 start_codon:yes stop_codon:yes gene_type:complete
MKMENIPADIKSKSIKEARDEIDRILVKLESKKLDLGNIDDDYKRLIILNKHVENLFKLKSKKKYNTEKIKINDKK